MRGGIKTLKHNVRTPLQLSYQGCKYLTHTSKARHVKRTQMTVTVRFTIRVTSLPRWNKQGIKICDWFLAYYLRSEVTWMQICASLKHHKKKKAEPNWLIRLKPIENLLELSIFFSQQWVRSSLLACFLLFQTGKNRMQPTIAWKDVELKIRTVARKSWIGGLNFRKGTWNSESLIKSLLICSVSYSQLEGLSSPMPTVAIGLV